MSPRAKKLGGSMVALVLATTVGGQASAEIICATAKKTTWNVPNGGLIVNRSKGPVKVILDSVGEWGTHNVISHGTDFFVTHATSKEPDTQDSCSVPIQRVDLENAGPGASAISLPALYVYYFGTKTWSKVIGVRGTPAASANPLGNVLGMEWYSGNSPNADTGTYEGRADQPTQVFPAFSDRGGRTADFLWNWPLYQRFDLVGFTSVFPPVSSPAGEIYRLKADDGRFMRYGFNQYLNMRNVHKGDANGNPGVVCSTLPAFATWRANQGGILPHTRYTTGDKKRAIDAIWNMVHDQCESGDDELFSSGFWDQFACDLTGFDVCARAADQVTNAFAVDKAELGKRFETIRNDSSITPFTISSDCLTGMNGKCAKTGGGSSPWAWDAPRQVLWSGSTAFRCWSN